MLSSLKSFGSDKLIIFIDKLIGLSTVCIDISTILIDRLNSSIIAETGVLVGKSVIGDPVTGFKVGPSLGIPVEDEYVG
jgi:hypothetical protein